MIMREGEVGGDINGRLGFFWGCCVFFFLICIIFLFYFLNYDSNFEVCLKLVFYFFFFEGIICLFIYLY